MEREAIIEYLEKVKEFADNEYTKKPINKWYAIGYGINNILRKVDKYNDEELLEIAMNYEDVLPLDFND